MIQEDQSWFTISQDVTCWPQKVQDDFGWPCIIPHDSSLGWLLSNFYIENQKNTSSSLFWAARHETHLVWFSWQQKRYLHLHPTLQKNLYCQLWDKKIVLKSVPVWIFRREVENYWGGLVLSNSIVKCFLSVPSGVESAFNEPNRKFGNFAGGRKSKLD